MHSQSPPRDTAFFVAIAGNIGTGKSGLTGALAETLGARPLPERIDANPFFDRFYEDPKTWAFKSQVAFAAESLSRHVEAIRVLGPAVQDRTAYEAFDVFARVQFQIGNLDADELRILRVLRDSAAALPRQPNLLIYLHASIPSLLQRIAVRDRLAERSVDSEYLEQLQFAYDQFAADWRISPVMFLDTDICDLRDRDEIDSLLSEVRCSARKMWYRDD